MNLPFVSIIVPVYNAEKTIEKCIKSLLNQIYPKNKYEIIIVDNNSNDKTIEIIKKYLVKILKKTKIQSSYAARNKGIKNAKGEILAFTDADCIADKNWLKNGIKGFANKNVGCVAGEIKSSNPENYIEEYLADKKELSQLKISNEFPLPYPKTANAFYKKEVFDKIGLFEEKWISGGDADLAWRMQLETNYKIKFAPNSIVYHKHRSTIKSMFGQCIKWGIGSSLLQKKYPNKIKKRTLKQNIWTYCRLVFITPSILLFLMSNKEKTPKNKIKKYLNLISWAGWEIGKKIGYI